MFLINDGLNKYVLTSNNWSFLIILDITSLSFAVFIKIIYQFLSIFIVKYTNFFHIHYFLSVVFCCKQNLRYTILFILFDYLTIILFSKQFRINWIFSYNFSLFIKSDKISLPLSILIYFFIQFLLKKCLTCKCYWDWINLDYISF